MTNRRKGTLGKVLDAGGPEIEVSGRKAPGVPGSTFATWLRSLFK